MFELQSQVMADPKLKLRTVVAVPDDKADLQIKCLSFITEPLEPEERVSQYPT